MLTVKSGRRYRNQEGGVDGTGTISRFVDYQILADVLRGKEYSYTTLTMLNIKRGEDGFLFLSYESTVIQRKWTEYGHDAIELGLFYLS